MSEVIYANERGVNQPAHAHNPITPLLFVEPHLVTYICSWVGIFFLTPFLMSSFYVHVHVPFWKENEPRCEKTGLRGFRPSLT